MGEITMYHATDASNKDSILEDGLQPGDSRGLVFLTTSEEEAERVAEIYDTIDEPVVFAASVMECHLREDPDPHGDLDSRAHDGSVRPVDLEAVA